jgi:hypothetical protein
MATTRTLTLHETQVAMLTRLGISVDALYIVQADFLHPTAVRVDGYASGHYVFFTDGNSEEHARFLKYLFGNEYLPRLKAMDLGLSIYQSPTAKYISAENLVSVTTTTETNFVY